MKAVDILLYADSRQYGLLIQCIGERQLHQYSMHTSIRVQFPHQHLHFLLSGSSRQFVPK